MSGEDEVELHVECADCQEQHRKANDMRLAAAEARAAYWKADSDLSRLICFELKTDKDEAVCGATARRGEALAKLRALGAEP